MQKKLRYSLRDYPNTPKVCSQVECVYFAWDELCDNPWINAGNSDADCYGKPKQGLIWLGLLDENGNPTK